MEARRGGTGDARSIDSDARRTSSTGYDGTAAPRQTDCPATNSAYGSTATAMATWITTSAVHVRPSCIREPREASCWSPPCTLRPVALSAGTTPTMAAASTARHATYATSAGDRPSSNQNGSWSEFPPFRKRGTHARPSCAAASPATAAASESTSASVKSCATTRRWLAPSAVRTTISPVRVAVRA